MSKHIAVRDADLIFYAWAPRDAHGSAADVLLYIREVERASEYLVWANRHARRIWGIKGQDARDVVTARHLLFSTIRGDA